VTVKFPKVSIGGHVNSGRPIWIVGNWFVYFWR